MNNVDRPSSNLESLVERQLRQWELSRAAANDDYEREVFPFIAMSRQVGAGAEEIAARIGQSLRWPVLDREILQAMSENDALRQRLYEGIDERDATWLEGMLEGLLLRQRPSDYRRRLATTLLTIVRQGPAIILGRGADLILPREYGLRVRIVAPLEMRLRRYAASNGIDPAQARRYVVRIDQERREFIRRGFRSGPDDPLRFDLILNTERFSLEVAHSLVVRAFESIRQAKK